MHMEITIKELKPVGLKTKAHEYLMEHQNSIWGAFQTHITTGDFFYAFNSELILEASTDQNTKLNAFEWHVKELSILLKEEPVNQLNQNSSWSNEMIIKSRQKLFRFCSHYRKS